MVNAQEYINNNYPKETTKININDKNLEGELIIQDFPNLEKIECRNNKDLTSIKLIDLPKLDCFHSNNCSLKEVVINNCPNITLFNAANNQLSDIKFLDGLNSEKLTALSLHTNNFPKQSLECFSNFTNLEQLFLDNCDEERFKKGEYNKFTGSLKPLQNLGKLELLSIGNTNINSGLEYLPKSFRKIGLNDSWWESDYGSYYRLRQELERATQIKEVTEKLKSEREENYKGEEDPAWFSDYYRIAPWRQAQQLARKFGYQDAQKWFDKNYSKDKRAEVIFLNINGKDLRGELDLSDFVNLVKLDCSFNQLTNLDLSDCPNLTHLNCSSNKFINTDFLKTIPNKEKLKVLRINNNKEIKESLEWLRDFVGLSILSLEECPFYGSLEPSKRINELKRIHISNTDISEGLEHLPESCKVYCDTSDYKYKSMEITKELSKFVEGSYYNIPKWKEDRENSLAANSIPLERLFIARKGIEEFITKWVKDYENNWYEWFFAKLRMKKEEQANEFSRLQHPKELWKHRTSTYITKFISQVSTVAGTALTLQPDGIKMGIGILAIAPFTELVSWKLEEELKNKEEKWNEFISDSTELLGSYHDLLGTLEQVKRSELGEVNQALNDLREKVSVFLDTYDEPREDGVKNGIVSFSEIMSRKKEFGKDLSKEDLEKGGGSQLGDIVLAIKELEKEIINYRQGISEKYEKIVKWEEEVGGINSLSREVHQAIDLDNHFEEKEAQIQVPPK